MAPRPALHPFARDDAHRRRAILAHPAGSRRREPGDTADTLAALRRIATMHVPDAPDRIVPSDTDDGSITTEYGLIVVVGATICSLVIRWASGGAVFELLGSVLKAAKGLVGI